MTWFPLTHDGRQTLIYCSFVLAGPVLTGLTIWEMHEALQHELFSTFSSLAWSVALCHLIVVFGLASAVGIRAFKWTKDGVEMTARDDGES